MHTEKEMSEAEKRAFREGYQIGMRDGKTSIMIGWAHIPHFEVVWKLSKTKKAQTVRKKATANVPS